MKGKGYLKLGGATLGGEKSDQTPAAEGPHLGREIGLDSSSLRCCETKEEEEKPNPATIDSRRKSRPTRIDQGKEVDVRAQGKGTSRTTTKQDNFLFPYSLFSFHQFYMIEMQIPLFNLVCMESLLDRYDNPRRGEQGFNNNFFFNNNKT